MDFLFQAMRLEKVTINLRIWRQYSGKLIPGKNDFLG
jgi:hypothetical protein